MSDDRSILSRLGEEGCPVPRVRLGGDAPSPESDARYRIVGEIARGGMGVVLRGRDNDLGREVAVKVLRDEFLGDPAVIRRFVEEAQIAGQLQHPGILPVYELGLSADSKPWFVMKLVQGETLAARLAARSGPEDGRHEILRIFRETCLAMAYSHSRGVIHRDLKPANIMIGPFGEVQVVDWGFAKILRKGGVHDEGLARRADEDETLITTMRAKDGSSDSVAGSVMGTPAYMSPEQALGRLEELDEKSDMFSLGAVLAEILTGQPPWVGSQIEQLMAAARAEIEPAFARLDACGADPRLVSLARRCLEPLRKDRPASVKAVADEIGEFLREREQRAHDARLRAVEAEAQAEAQRRSRRHAAMICGIGLAVVVLAGGAWLWRSADVRRREGERRAAIETALQATTLLRAAGDWEGALKAADRAVQLGHRSELTDEIRRQAAEALAAAARAREDEEFLAELEDIRKRARPMPEGVPSATPAAMETEGLVLESRSGAETDAAYAAAFDRRFGGLAPAVERLAASAHAREFAANLGFWCWIRKVELKAEDWEGIDQAARRIDPGHAAVRDALMSGDRDALLAIAAGSGEDMPVTLAAEVGRALGKDDEAAPAALDFLRRQQLRDPTDFWVNCHLAAAAEKVGEFRLAARHYQAALAAQPLDALTWCQLGQVLYSHRDRLPFDREGAIRAFERVCELAWNDPVMLAYAGGGLSNLGERDRALQVLRRAVELDPHYFPALDHLGITLFERGDLEEAAEVLHRAILENPDDAGTVGTLGSVYARMERLEEAEKYTRRAIELDPEKAFLHSNLANTLVKRGEAEASGTALNRALELGPDDFRVLISGALTLEALGRNEEALELAEHATEVAPTNPGTWQSKGGMLSSRRRYEEAAAAYRRGIELAPRNPKSLHGNLAAALGNLGRLDEALAEILIELRDFPGNADAHRIHGWILLRSGDPAGAAAALRRAVELQPSAVIPHAMLAEALEKIGDDREAEKEFDWLLEHAPDTENVHLNRAVVIMKQGRAPEAVRLFGEIVKTDPGNPLATLYLAMSLETAGQRDAALPLYRRAAELAPDNPNVAVSFAEALARASLAVEAHEARLRAFALDIRDPALLVRLGGQMSDGGEIREAASLLRRAIAIDPRTNMAHRFLGITLARLGDRDGATQAFLEVLELRWDEGWTLAQAGSYLFDLGGLEPALRALRRSVELEPGYPFARDTLALAEACSRVVAGEEIDLPSRGLFRVAGALRAQGRFADAAKLCRQAFESDPSLVADPLDGTLYRAACAAARAGAEWRDQALAWLRTSLDALMALPPERWEVRSRILELWQQDADLASLRDAGDLPEAARRLWADVEALRRAAPDGAGSPGDPGRK